MAIQLKHALVLALVLLAGCAGTPAGKHFDTPGVELLSFKPMGSEGMEARFGIVLRIINPNSMPLEIEGIYYELAVQEKDLLSGASNTPVTIESYSEGQIELVGSASMRGAFRLIAELIDKPPTYGFAYQLNTKISLKGYPLPIRIEKEGLFGDNSLSVRR